MPTVTWTITSIECKIQDQGYQDVVYTVVWYATAEQDGTTANVFGTQLLQFDPTAPDYQFIPYDELTEPIVIGWVQGAMGPMLVEANEQQAVYLLNQILYPSVENKPLPWAPPTPPNPILSE